MLRPRAYVQKSLVARESRHGSMAGQQQSRWPGDGPPGIGREDTIWHGKPDGRSGIVGRDYVDLAR